MLRPFFPELVMSTDLLSFEHPSLLLFCFLNVCKERIVEIQRFLIRSIGIFQIGSKKKNRKYRGMFELIICACERKIKINNQTVPQIVITSCYSIWRSVKVFLVKEFITHVLIKWSECEYYFSKVLQILNEEISPIK